MPRVMAPVRDRRVCVGRFLNHVFCWRLFVGREKKIALRCASEVAFVSRMAGRRACKADCVPLRKGIVLAARSVGVCVHLRAPHWHPVGRDGPGRESHRLLHHVFVREEGSTRESLGLWKWRAFHVVASFVICVITKAAMKRLWKDCTELN